MKIGYAYVCGDILHYGHIRFLESAKALCDNLVVGVLSDKAIMEKKPKPTIPFKERIKMIQALNCIDLAIVQKQYSPSFNIYIIEPSILFESTSHKEPFKNPYGRTIILPYFIEQSSSKIKEKIKNG